MAHAGQKGAIEFAVVPIVEAGRVSQLVYAFHQAPSTGLFGRIGQTFDFLIEFWWQFILAGVLASLIALLMARWLARGMTQPLRDHVLDVDMADRSGAFHRRIKLAADEEIARLRQHQRPLPLRLRGRHCECGRKERGGGGANQIAWVHFLPP